MDIQNLKESKNTPHPQYAAPLDTNLVALQQQLSKMKEDIKHSAGLSGNISEPPTVWWFVNDVTKLSILLVHAQQTCRLQEPPCVTTRITNTTM